MGSLSVIITLPHEGLEKYLITDITSSISFFSRLNIFSNSSILPHKTWLYFLSISLSPSSYCSADTYSPLNYGSQKYGGYLLGPRYNKIEVLLLEAFGSIFGKNLP